MRFHQLEVGAQFEFQGASYIKSTNLIAVRQTDGSQKFMQRSATVTPLTAHSATRDEDSIRGDIDIETVKQAHERFYHTCMASVKNLPLNQQALSALTRTLKQASEKFIDELNR